MKIHKTVTERVIAANREKSRKSTGSTTAAGKRHARMNAIKHGFFAKELQLGEEDRPEFEVLRDSLSEQFAPETPMQHIAVENIVCCCWRCKLALRIESRPVALQPRLNEETKGDAAGGGTILMEQWYAADYRTLQNGLIFLRDFRGIVADSGLLHLEHDGPLKESFIKGFGSNFYNRLIEWNGMSTTAILFAEHFAAMGETYKLKPLGFDVPERDPEHPEVVADPRLKWEMVLKLIDCEIEHLSALIQIRRQTSGDTPQALLEFSPRYFADASRDLQRAVDWFLKLKLGGL